MQETWGLRERKRCGNGRGGERETHLQSRGAPRKLAGVPPVLLESNWIFLL